MTTIQDEDVSDWADIPLFAPEGATIPNLSGASEDEVPSEALSALSHLLHDEETPEEKSEYLRSEGNRYFMRRGKRDLKTAVEMYTEAVDVAKGDVASETAALNNRAAAHMKLGNYGYALQDSLRAGRLSKNNVKAHYRASVSATKLEKLDVALLSTESGMKACKSGHGTSADAKLLKQQKQLIAETRKKIEERERRQREQRSKLEDVSSMFARRNIQVRRVEYAQQAEYERTKPHLVDDEWCWPVLLVYQSQNHGEQSDYLASVNENVTLSEIIDLVFGQDTQPPWWDVDNAYEDTSNLRVLVRTNEDYDDDNSDSDDGWTVNEHVKWMPLGNEETIGEVVCRKHYKVPLYPVLHIVPRVIAKNLNNL